MLRKLSSFWRSGAFWARLGASIAILLLIAFAGVVFWLRSNARAQREAVAAIKAGRGHVSYPWDDPDGCRCHRSRFLDPAFPNWLWAWTWSGGESEELGPAAPAWLVSLLGVDCFGDVTSVVMPPRTRSELIEQLGHLEQAKKVQIQDSLMTEDEMKSLGRLVHLESLTVVRTKVVKGGFAHLANLKNLRTLSLDGTNVDDEAALSSLKDLTALTEINLEATMISDAGTQFLSTLINLEYLNLNGTMISDTSLSQLAGLPALSRLALNGTRLNGAGLAYLKGLPRLEELNLESTGVGNAGLAHLAGAISLKLLHLKGTAVTDAGVTHLKGLTNLEDLSLDHTAITDASLAELTTLPHLMLLSVQQTRITADAINVQKRRRAHLQVQQLTATSNGVVPAETAITELEIVH